ncbi:hypothetical protein Misp01_29490 [Microtetraspora sp. NBRC 13810]|uniref:VOC family protein n=1 Tax=Microtetraspora sp. NBRC 13810 TaxID=3030990 RepID=UPI0024A246DA|nr:VOC family protein [Microtetraspora sp. NBRC 13810]GLW07819.1 hypothetical protein Misp01_29490 [Microtetraspora sp. NBRC 13810]
MRDPFEALREDVVPVEPDPGFAARLRERLERAVLDPTRDWRSENMTTATRLRQGDIGFASLWVPDADRAAAFYREVLGWRYAPDGQDLRIEEVTPGLAIRGGEEHRGLFLGYVVDDVTRAAERVRRAGGRAGEPAREPYGLAVRCEDRQGLPFAVYEPAAEARAAAEPRPGEVCYLTIDLVDAAEAREFYGAVLGWEFVPGSVPDGWAVRTGGAEVRPMTGLWGGRERSVAVPMYSVADIGAAVARVRELGGTGTDPQGRPYGIEARCLDDQGTPFYLGQLGG